LTPSRLGFRGVEDLGGGTSAIFTAEFQLYPQDGTLSGNTNSGLLNRQTFVGLSQKGLGTVKIGQQFTPMFVQAARTDPGGMNGTVGSVIWPSNNSSDVSSSAFQNRVANSLMVDNVKAGGFGASAFYSGNNRDTTQTGAPNAGGTNGGNTNINGFGGNIDYTWKKVYATLAFQSFRNENPSTVVTVTPSSTTLNNGSNVIDNSLYAGLTYDFGRVKAYAQYVDRKITSVIDSNQYVSRSAQQLGVRGKITSKVDGWVSVGNGAYKSYGSGQPTANFVGYQVGSLYNMSKRTAVYAIVGSIQTTSENGATSAGANQYATGIRHTF
jgi:predicted porin